MKLKTYFLFFIFLTTLSCSTPRYILTNQGQSIGVDFTRGKWLLNELDCQIDCKEKLTLETFEFFKKNLNDSLFYMKNTKGLLVPKKIPLNPNQTKLKELKEGTGFDYFINISTKRNKNEMNSIELYQTDNEVAINQSEVTLEIYDLNSKLIIYSQRVVGSTSKEKNISVWQTPKSDKLIDNINFYKSTNGLMLGSLKKILKDLKKKSIKN
ncbi:hypothetical protein [Flavobacterium sp. IMCC34518]|jgi:hypothetical protein|uniref:hypothetical protein n=1 Tax=Flavobacterium sp. IMCC34518 TaxID=3003623 RepID=UPI002482E478|nr:hypothetical protein [Flavobacterium sp. IMCC34518]